MRHSEFWERMRLALGSDSYAKYWSEQQVMSSLGGRSPREALDAGEAPKAVWSAVHEVLGLPASER